MCGIWVYIQQASKGVLQQVSDLHQECKVEVNMDSKQLGEGQESVGSQQVEEEQKNDQISFSEFLEVIAAKMFDGNAENDLIQAFKIFDAEGRGVVNAFNLKKSLLEIDKDMTEEELYDLMKDLKDEDGNINYSKLVREFLFNQIIDYNIRYISYNFLFQSKRYTIK